MRLTIHIQLNGNYGNEKKMFRINAQSLQEKLSLAVIVSNYSRHHNSHLH